MTDNFFTRPEANDRGLSDSAIRSEIRHGKIVRISYGAFAEADAWSTLDAVQRHRAVVRATALRASPDSVVSHVSAAAIHGLPVLHPQWTHVHLSRHGAGGGHRGARVLHCVTLPQQDVTVVDGLPVTTLARTAVDLACAGTFDQAVCVIESVLRAGVDKTEVSDALARIGKRRGIALARKACVFADGRTESIGESWSRALMTRWRDVPPPRLQHRFVDDRGVLIARTDFDWEGLLVGEFDGLVKYADGSDSVVKEKLREDALRLLGVHVVRWTWADLLDPRRLHRILSIGLARAGL